MVRVCQTATMSALTPALTLRRSDRLLSPRFPLAVATQHYCIYLRRYEIEISIQNSRISSLLMEDFTDSVSTHTAVAASGGEGAALGVGLSCAPSDYFGGVLSGGRVTALSIYVKRLGHPEIRRTALRDNAVQASQICLCV